MNIGKKAAIALITIFLSAFATPSLAASTISGWTIQDSLSLKVSDLAIKGDYAYISGKDGGIRVVDIHDPKNLRTVRTVTIPGATAALQNTYPGKLFISGNYLIGFGIRHVYVFSIVDVTQPVLLQSFTPNELSGGLIFTSDLQIVGRTAYIAAGNALLIYDVSNMSSWTLLGTYQLPYFARNVFLSHGYAFITVEKVSASEPTGWLYILDVRKNTTPILVKKMRTNNIGADVRVQWPFAYVADGKYLSIYNIASPSNPILTQKKSFLGSIGTVIGTSDTNLLMYLRYGSNGAELRGLRLSGGSTARQSTLPAVPGAKVAFSTNGYMYTIVSSGKLVSYKLK